MRAPIHRRLARQFDLFRRPFLQLGGLPFTDALSSEVISEALATIKAPWNDRIFSPLVTLWVFLEQVLNPDHSCRAAVARLIAYRVARGMPACSSETGAYCQARKRLPLSFFATVARRVGHALDSRSKAEWLWKGRRVHLFDGSSVMMPETPENRREYPLTYNQTLGGAFPVARIAAVISLSCGAILDLGICRYAGKGQSESGLLRKMWGLFRAGDVMLADRLMCAWTEMVILKRRGVDTVCRLTSHRRADFRRGTRLGKYDHIVEWKKPQKPRTVDRELYDSLPGSMFVRECRVAVVQRGFRTRSVIVVTTILDAERYTKGDFAGLYRARWNVELDLRSIKSVMQMDLLRCKAPELVRKEIWVHVLAYNLIRTVAAQAAREHELAPREISFKATLQVLEAFRPVIISQAHPGHDHRLTLYHEVLRAISRHRVGDRPDRFEPRAAKRKPSHYDFLKKERRLVKLDILKRLKHI